MANLFRDGGFSMFFILGFGGVSLGWAGWYALKATTRSLAFVRAMMLATLFSTGVGVCSDLGMVFKTLSGSSELDERRQAMARDKEHRVDLLLEGLGESMAPAIMGLSLLTLTSLLLAVGSARVPRVEESAA